MNKGIDLIQRAQYELIDGYPTGNIYIGVTKDEYNELENELKVLEIIKNKKVDIELFNRVKTCKEYNYSVGFSRLNRDLTQEEYDLLKEVLKND